MAHGHPTSLTGPDMRALTEVIDEVAAALWAVRSHKRRALFFKAVDPVVFGVAAMFNLVIAFWIAAGPTVWLLVWLFLLSLVELGAWAGIAWRFGDRMPVDSEMVNLVALRLFELNRLLKSVEFEGEAHWNIELGDVAALAIELADLKRRVQRGARLATHA